MPEIEKVISHLRIIRTWAKVDGERGRGIEPKCCADIVKWLDEALNALKAQQPRVLTLEEVRNNIGDPAWFESRGTYRGKKGFWVLLGETDARLFTKKLMCSIGMTSTELGLSAYGEVWRCWTSRPDEKVRTEMPWDY